MALHAAFAYLVLKDDVPARIAVRLGILTTPDWPGVELIQETHRKLDGLVPAGSAIFLGDSITEGLDTSSVVAASINYGIGGQRSDQLLKAMPVYTSMDRASVVVITIGTNDVLQGRTKGIEQRYRAILSSVPPRVRVVLSAPPPMPDRDVQPVVTAARAACMEDRRCTFVDVPPLDLLDGVHPSPTGYSTWAGLLRATITGRVSP